jgi:hypothetical protein
MRRYVNIVKNWQDDAGFGFMATILGKVLDAAL